MPSLGPQQGEEVGGGGGTPCLALTPTLMEYEEGEERSDHSLEV